MLRCYESRETLNSVKFIGLFGWCSYFASRKWWLKQKLLFETPSIQKCGSFFHLQFNEGKLLPKWPVMTQHSLFIQFSQSIYSSTVFFFGAMFSPRIFQSPKLGSPDFHPGWAHWPHGTLTTLALRRFFFFPREVACVLGRCSTGPPWRFDPRHSWRYKGFTVIVTYRI